MNKINVTEYIRSSLQYLCGPDCVDNPAFDEARKHNIESELNIDCDVDPRMPVRPWDFYKQLLEGRAVLIPRNGKISIKIRGGI